MAATTWNPSDKGSIATLSNGNLTVDGKATGGWARSVFGASSGKWYWEYTSTGSRYPICGIGKATASSVTDIYPGSDADGWSYFGNVAKKVNNAVQTAYGSTWASSGDVIGVALDLNAGTLEFFKNGSSMGVAFTGLSAGTYYAMTGGDTDSATSNTTANFGATAFAYTPPTGFTAGFGAFYSISGTVKDSAGAFAARTVRAYKRSDGSMVGSTTSDGTTGAWSIPCGTNDEVDLIVLDNATSGTIYNDLIDRVIPA